MRVLLVLAMFLVAVSCADSQQVSYGSTGEQADDGPGVSAGLKMTNL
ncbi:MAG: hypothetical protein OXK21_07440 [Chloroflexota bacterium]|nr:hypothetical protein [Chloroflexota bacterium]